MHVGTFLTLRAVCVFNAALLLVLAAILAIFMQHPAGIVAAALCCLAAGLAIGGAQYLDRLYERSR
jgi:hypothetical protein